jgi:hypothetical protein
VWWPHKNVRPLLFAALAVATLGYFSEYSFKNDFALWGSVLLAALWGTLLCGGVIRFRWQGLWLLLGAPLALYWPWAIWMMVRACQHNIRACP